MSAITRRTLQPLKAQELRERAAELNLPTSGTKSALIDRICRHHRSLRPREQSDESVLTPPHAHSTRPNGPGSIPPAPRPASEAELQQTVQHMVDRSLQGLEERLLRALRPTTPAAAVADNLSLPSPCQGTSQREHGAHVTDEAASHETPANEALATGVTSPLTVQQPQVPRTHGERSCPRPTPRKPPY